MPTYEYLCKTCGTQFEVFQSFHDKALKTHDGCGGPVQKVFHARGIVFKGSGFYATDSRSGSASSTKSGTSDDSKSDSKSDSKTDSKTDSKKDSKNDSRTDSRAKNNPKSTTGTSGSDD
jgi:putative FmdB family regulatory protein